MNWQNDVIKNNNDFPHMTVKTSGGGHNYQTDTKFKKVTNHYSQLWFKNEIRENTSGVNTNSL